MSKGRILIVEDDPDISNTLRIYFGSQGHDVLVASWGQDALETCRRKLPNIIVLDIMLPDIDGYEVLRRLRNNLRTRHIPVLFCTQKDERSDKIAGLELGADDYITKPFMFEELKWRVLNALKRAQYENLTNPTTGLPSAKLIEEQLKRLIFDQGWALLYIGINDFEPFKEVHGFATSDDVLRFVAMILIEAVEELGTVDDFIGHVGGDDFFLTTTIEKAPALRQRLTERFSAEVGMFYSFREKEQGFIRAKNTDGTEVQVPLMSLTIGMVQAGIFGDIREITEAAAEARRKSRFSNPSHPHVTISNSRA